MNSVARRRLIKHACAYLREDLYQRDYDYSKSSASMKEVKPIEVDNDREMLWGSPLGWRVVFRVEGDLGSDSQRVVATVYNHEAKEHSKFVFTDENCNSEFDIEHWLHEVLP
jgi:hypothetical protein